MDLTPEQIRGIARLVDLDIPEADIESVALRLSSLLTEMETIERELGSLMDKTEPIPPVYPRLAGQHADYVATQLRAFRAEQRSNDANKTMRMIAARMSDKEMQAVAEFISGLR